MLLNNTLQILAIVDVFFFWEILKKLSTAPKKIVAPRAPKQSLKKILYIFYQDLFI